MTASSIPNPYHLNKSGSVSPLGAMRPRFVNELVLVPSREGIIVDGAHRPQIIQGKSAQAVMRNLIPLMDGTRTLQELAVMLPGIAPAQVHAAALLLFDAGIIEDCSSSGISDASPNFETLAFFRRYLGSTAVNSSGSEAYQKLCQGQVAIIQDDSRTAEILKNLLEKTGVGRVATAGQADLEHWQPGPRSLSGRSLLVSMATQGEDKEWSYRLDEWSSVHHLPWLRAVVDESKNYADIGPLFDSTEGPCYRCFQDLHGALPPAPPARSSHGFFVSMVAVEVIYLLTRLGPLLTGPGFHRYQLDPWRARRLGCSRIPGCPRCRPISGNSGRGASADRVLGQTNTALVFEDYVGASSRIQTTARQRLSRSKKGDVPSPESKRLLNCEAFALKRDLPKFDQGILDALDTPGRASGRPMTLSQLSILLLLSAGIKETESRDNQVKRWAPTSGNLGSVELYVAARTIEGLQPGLYLYQPVEHSLALFRRHHQVIEVDEFMRRVMIEDASGLPEALLIVTGAFYRIAKKYDAFGYRLLNLDAGVCASQAHLVARCLGVASQTVTWWADDLIEEQLNLMPLQEQVTAMISLSGRSSSAQPILGLEGKMLSGSADTDHLTPACGFSNLELPDVVARIYMESRIQESKLHVQPREVPAELPATMGPSQTGLSLPPPLIGGGRLVGDVLALRRSIRHFTPEPVTLQQLSCLLACASRGDIHDWPEEYRAGQSLQFVVFAWNVKDVAPATYIYREANHSLGFLAPPPSPAKSLALFVQEEFAGAPVVIWIVGNLAAACARHGAFGHRQLLLRAGAAGHRVSMAAAGTGLAGSLVAGLVPGEARRQFGFDGYQRASLLAVALGFESRFFRVGAVGTYGAPSY